MVASLIFNPMMGAYIDGPLAHLHSDEVRRLMGRAMRNRFAVERDEQEAEIGRRLAADISAGRIPDWPAWSVLMREERL